MPSIANECEGCSLFNNLTNVRSCNSYHRLQCGVDDRKIFVTRDSSICDTEIYFDMGHGESTNVTLVVSYLDYELTDSIRKEITQIIPDINQELLSKSYNLRNLIENLWKIQR